MAKADAHQPDYTHHTDLSDRSNAKVSIVSDTLPIELRLAVPADAPALLKVFSDPRNVEHDPSAAGLDTLPAIEKMIMKWGNLPDALTRLNLVVLAKGEIVGLSGSGHIYTREDGKRVADAGIIINPEARGKGYAYESLRITIDYSLRILQLDEVTVEMRDANMAMRGLMDKKFGLRPTVSPDLKFGDEYSYRVTRKEWL